MRTAIVLFFLTSFFISCSRAQVDPSLDEPYCQCYDSVFRANGMDYDDEYQKYIDSLVEIGVLMNGKSEGMISFFDSMVHSERPHTIPPPSNKLFMDNYFRCSQFFVIDSLSRASKAFGAFTDEIAKTGDFIPRDFGKALKEHISPDLFEQREMQHFVLLMLSSIFYDDIGLKPKLPPYPDPNSKPVSKSTSSDVFTVYVTSEDSIIAQGKTIKLENLSKLVFDFLMDTSGLEGHPRLRVVSSEYGNQTSNRAIISLKNDRGTSYKMYVAVYNELVRAYNEGRDQASQNYFGTSYRNLEGDRKKFIRKILPMKISEAEPVNKN